MINEIGSKNTNKIVDNHFGMEWVIDLEGLLISFGHSTTRFTRCEEWYWKFVYEFSAIKIKITLHKLAKDGQMFDHE